MPNEPAASRLLSVGELFCERLVHDSEAAFLLVVVIAEIAAAQWNAHHIEVTRASLDWNRDRQRARAFELRAFNINAAAVVVEAKRKVISQRSIFDLRQSLCMFEHLLLKGATARFVIALQADIEGNRHHIFRVESRPHLLSSLQTTDNEAGADKQDQ